MQLGHKHVVQVLIFLLLAFSLPGIIHAKTEARIEAGSLKVPPPPPIAKGPVPTHLVIRAVAHGALVLGQEVGGARITITDVKTGVRLASGLQQGEAGDQNQIMRTPHLMEEQVYASLPSASFQTTLQLEEPTWVDITAQGPLAFPAALTQTTKRVLLIPGQDLRRDGIILDLSGYIIEIQRPVSGKSLIGKADVQLVASIKTLSGSLVKPYGDWDSRKIQIWGEVLVGNRIVERLQMFYTGEKSLFAAPFFVPVPSDAPDGITLRVMASDGARGNFGLSQANYPVLPEQAAFRKQ